MDGWKLESILFVVFVYVWKQMTIACIFVSVYLSLFIPIHL